MKSISTLHTMNLFPRNVPDFVPWPVYNFTCYQVLEFLDAILEIPFFTWINTRFYMLRGTFRNEKSIHKLKKYSVICWVWYHCPGETQHCLLLLVFMIASSGSLCGDGVGCVGLGFWQFIVNQDCSLYFSNKLIIETNRKN